MVINIRKHESHHQRLRSYSKSIRILGILYYKKTPLLPSIRPHIKIPLLNVVNHEEGI